ncbi:unnamed protein product, partial [Rotaria sp. Silwood1]
GVKISTPIGYISKSDQFHNNELETIYGWGDGEQDDTTNMSCQLWKNTMDIKYKLILKGFNKVNHLELVGNDYVLEEISQIIFS